MGRGGKGAELLEGCQKLKSAREKKNACQKSVAGKGSNSTKHRRSSAGEHQIIQSRAHCLTSHNPLPRDWGRGENGHRRVGQAINRLGEERTRKGNCEEGGDDGGILVQFNLRKSVGGERRSGEARFEKRPCRKRERGRSLRSAGYSKKM